MNFKYVVVLEKNVTIFAGMIGIECFAIEMSRVAQNLLKISDGQDQ